jgi:hypothetical protein
MADVSEVSVALSCSLNGRLVENTSPEADEPSVRTDEACIVVLDNIVSDQTRGAIHAILLGQSEASQNPSTPPQSPPAATFASDTADSIGSGVFSPGARDDVLDHLQSESCTAINDLLASMKSLYRSEVADIRLLHDVDTSRCVLANAPSPGESQYGYHVDAEPATLADCEFVNSFGRFVNRSPGKPRLVSLLMYTNSSWDHTLDNGETLFVDDGSACGVLVAPKPGRVVLMDSDVRHRVQAPKASANKPRYSVVLKLAFLPRSQGSTPSLTKPIEHKRSCVAFGSAQTLADAAVAASTSRKRQRRDESV